MRKCPNILYNASLASITDFHLIITLFFRKRLQIFDKNIIFIRLYKIRLCFWCRLICKNRPKERTHGAVTIFTEALP